MGNYRLCIVCIDYYSVKRYFCFSPQPTRAVRQDAARHSTSTAPRRKAYSFPASSRSRVRKPTRTVTTKRQLASLQTQILYSMLLPDILRVSSALRWWSKQHLGLGSNGPCLFLRGCQRSQQSGAIQGSYCTCSELRSVPNNFAGSGGIKRLLCQRKTSGSCWFLSGRKTKVSVNFLAVKNVLICAPTVFPHSTEQKNINLGSRTAPPLGNTRPHEYFILFFPCCITCSGEQLLDGTVMPPCASHILEGILFTTWWCCQQSNFILLLASRVCLLYYWNVLWFLYHRNKRPKFRCNAAILTTQGEVAMETELHCPEMKASEDLDFHCTSIFNHRLFLHQLLHQHYN